MLIAPLPISSLRRLRIAVDYAVLRADVRERFTFAAVAPCAHTSPRSPARRDGGTFSPTRTP